MPPNGRIPKGWRYTLQNSAYAVAIIELADGQLRGDVENREVPTD